MNQSLIASSMLIAVTAAAWAAPLEFDFKDPKGVNNAVFKTDALLESINGTASGISGTVTFDPQNPGAVKGKIVVAADSLRVPNSMMQGHLHGEQWLNAAKFPEITFEVLSAKNAKTEGDKTTADVTGKFTVKGTTKEITVPIRMDFLKDKLAQRDPMKRSGDLLVIRAHFTIKRSDYGINTGQFEDKVSNDIELSLSVAGAAPRK